MERQPIMLDGCGDEAGEECWDGSNRNGEDLVAAVYVWQRAALAGTCRKVWRMEQL